VLSDLGRPVEKVKMFAPGKLDFNSEIYNAANKALLYADTVQYSVVLGEKFNDAYC
jgi:hypothetical protein